MFNYVKDAYRTIKDYYHAYTYSSDQSKKPNKIGAFFKAIFNYFFRRPQPVILNNNERKRFENGLDNRITRNYDVEYRAGSIILKPKGLVKRL